jgi:chromosome segregation ATPase
MTPPARHVGAAALALACALLASGCGEGGEGRSGAGKGALYHYRLAAEKYREGDFDAAIGIYEKSIQMNPGLAEAHLDLGIIYDDYKGAKGKAVEQYRAFLAIEPRSAKAEMVRRWIVKAEEDKGAPTPGGVASQAAVSGAPASPPRAGHDLAREDMAIVRAENEAYLKTVEALRNELTQARAEIDSLREAGAKAPAGSPFAAESTASAAALEAEKARLWERYRAEKADLVKTIDGLKEEIAVLRARKAAGDDALKEAHARIEAAARGTPAGAPLSSDLDAAQEKIRELERQVAASQRDRESLAARLLEAERRLQGYRMQSTSDSPILLAKVKADAEREREELRKKYERKLAEAASESARDRAGLQKAVAEARRAAAKAQEALSAPERPQGAARTAAEAEREKAELKQHYEKRLAEAASAAEREKAEAQRGLSEARREAAYLKDQCEKARASAGKVEQYSAGAMERLREQFRREKEQMEQQYRREREQLLARLSAQRIKAPTPAPPPQKQPSAPAGRAPRTAQRQQAPSVQRRVEPGAARPSSTARRYRTVRGDTLRSIAARCYGSPGRWKSIYDANRDTLQGQGGSSALKPGWILLIP